MIKRAVICSMLLLLPCGALYAAVDEAKSVSDAQESYARIFFSDPTSGLRIKKLSERTFRLEIPSRGLTWPSVQEISFLQASNVSIQQSNNAIFLSLPCACDIKLHQISPIELIITTRKSDKTTPHQEIGELGEKPIFPLLHNEASQFDLDNAPLNNSDSLSDEAVHIETLVASRVIGEYDRAPREFPTQFPSDLSGDCLQVNRYLDPTYASRSNGGALARSRLTDQAHSSEDVEVLLRDLFENGMFTEAKYVNNHLGSNEVNRSTVSSLLNLVLENQTERVHDLQLACNPIHSVLLVTSHMSPDVELDNRTKLRLIKEFNNLSLGLRLSLSDRFIRLLNSSTSDFVLPKSDAFVVMEPSQQFIPKAGDANPNEVATDGLAAVAVSARDTELACATSSSAFEAYLQQRRYFDAIRHISLETCTDDGFLEKMQQQLMQAIETDVDSLTLIEISDDLMAAFPKLAGDLASLIAGRGFEGKSNELRETWGLPDDQSGTHSGTPNKQENTSGLDEFNEAASLVTANESPLEALVSNDGGSGPTPLAFNETARAFRSADVSVDVSVETARNIMLTSQDVRTRILETLALQ